MQTVGLELKLRWTRQNNVGMLHKLRAGVWPPEHKRSTKQVMTIREGEHNRPNVYMKSPQNSKFPLLSIAWTLGYAWEHLLFYFQRTVYFKRLHLLVIKGFYHTCICFWLRNNEGRNKNYSYLLLSLLVRCWLLCFSFRMLGPSC